MFPKILKSNYLRVEQSVAGQSLDSTFVSLQGLPPNMGTGFSQYLYRDCFAGLQPPEHASQGYQTDQLPSVIGPEKMSTIDLGRKLPMSVM